MKPLAYRILIKKSRSIWSGFLYTYSCLVYLSQPNCRYSHHLIQTRTVEDACTIFPLFLYEKVTNVNRKQQTFMPATSSYPVDEYGRTPNINSDFIKAVEDNTSLKFSTKNADFDRGVFSPEILLNYIYAICSSQNYRSRFGEFLRLDFPRIPVTSDPDLFWRLSDLGRQLVSLHLLESPQLTHLITRYPVPGDNLVAKGCPK